MGFKAWVAILVIGAGMGEALALPALAMCDFAKGAAVSCCCSHDCAASAQSGPGMRSSCCDMRRAPAQSALPSAPPLEAAPVSAVAVTTAFILPPPVAPVTDAAPAVPASLHAPPLYDLFRSYRI